MTAFSLSYKTLVLGEFQDVGVAVKRLLFGLCHQKMSIQWSKEANKLMLEEILSAVTS